MQEDDVNAEFERALRGLKPQQTRVDGVAAAHAAGRRSARKGVRLWQSTAGLLLLAGIAGWLPRGAPGGSGVSPSGASIPMARAPVSDQSLIRLQQAINEHGVAGLPATRLSDIRPVRPDAL